MKRLSIGLFIVIVGALVWNVSRGVSITAVNQSSKNISSIRISYDGKTKSIDGISPSGTRRVTIYSRSEDTYSLSVTFADGSTLTTDERYVEPGYHVTERINDSAIEIAFDSLL